jgi:hypothetical protein
MKRSTCLDSLRFFFLLGLVSPIPVSAQQTNNAANLTNSAAPSASSVTTGGTNINYQTNNAYNNEMGFAPGVFCRTPTLYVGGNVGHVKQDNFDPIQESGNRNTTSSMNAGVLFPFGSRIIDYCKRYAATIAKDKEISSQVSMLKLCNELSQKNIAVDPEKFPLLAVCADDNQNTAKVPVTSPRTRTNKPINSIDADMKPTTTRSL